MPDHAADPDANPPGKPPATPPPPASADVTEAAASDAQSSAPATPASASEKVPADPTTGTGKPSVSGGNGKGNGNGDAGREFVAGQIVGGCEIIEKLGSGGMGAVYRARQIALDKSVALKVLAPRFANSSEFAKNFMREARLAARLEHENIVQVFDADEADGVSYIVMQYVSGTTLRDRLRKLGPLPMLELLDIAAQAASGISWAHQKRIVHRDVKPENLMRTDEGTIKVADFGLAREDEELVDDRPGRKIVASAGYMSPEHADIQPVDARSDCYSLGVTLYMLGCGRRPLYGDSHLELVLKHHVEEATPMTVRRREVPLHFSAMVQHLMEKRPEDRYQTADELIDDLKQVVRRNLPKAPFLYDDQDLEPERLLPLSISRTGVRRCLEIQSAMRQRGDRVLSLGQLMRANGYVETAPAKQSLFAADLPFLLPKDAADLDPALAAGPATAPGPWIGLQAYREQCEKETDPAARPKMRAAFFPALVEFMPEASRLVITPTRAFTSSVEVMHLYDLLACFPFVDTPRVTLSLAEDAPLAVEDVSWLVDSYNLVKRRGGHLEVRCIDAVSYAFFTGHRLLPYLDVAMLGDEGDSGDSESDGADSKSEVPEDTAVAMVTPVGSAASPVMVAPPGSPSGGPVKPRLNPLPLSVQPIAPLDEARSLLAAGDPLRAKQALAPLRAPGANVPDEAAMVSREIAERCIARGVEAIDAEHYDNAKQWFDHAIDADPKLAGGYFHKGLVLKKLGQLEYALRYLGQAIDVDREAPEFYYHRAIVHSRIGDLEAAVSDLTRAVELHPRHANAFYNRGIAHEKLGELAPAITDYKMALKLNPRFEKSLGARLKSLQARATTPSGIEPAGDS